MDEEAVYARISKSREKRGERGVMNVIHVPPPIVLVAYQVTPKTALPDVLFATTFAVPTYQFGDVFFDFAPTSGKILAVFR